MKKKKVDPKKLLQSLLIRLGVTVAISAPVSWYVSSIIHILLKAKKVVYNPFAFFRMYRFHGFPTGLFFFLMVCMGALVVYTMLKTHKSTARMDTERNFQYSESGIYGTAALIEDIDGIKDVATAKGSHEVMGTILGQLDDSGEKIINLNNDLKRINRHICVFGASSSGKSYSFVLPFALQAARRRESLIVTDPKGELYSKTANYFRRLGYVVRRFDLKNPGLSDGWDCLKEITNSSASPELRAQIFSHTVVANTSGSEDISNIHTGGPFMLLMALLLRVALDPSYKNKPEGQTLRACLKELSDPKGAEHLDGEVFDADTAPSSVKSALNTYNKFKGASANLYGNIITGLNSSLSSLSSPEVQELISRDDIDLSLPGKRPCVYYCVMSDMQSSLNFLGSLFFSFLFLDLAEFADSQPNQKCPVPVNFLLDEFRNIGSIPGFDQKIAVVRSRAMYISIILQDISQLRSRYPNTWSSIMSNCATHLCLGFNDEETAAYYSRRAGVTTAKVKTEQHEAMEPLIKFGRKHSTGDGRRDVMTSDELIRLSLDECLISIQSHNCMKARKFPVSSHPEYKYLIETNVEAYPNIMNREARDRLRHEEAEYIERYDKWLQNGNNPIPHLQGSEAEEIKKAYLSRKVYERPHEMSQELYDQIGYLDAANQLKEADRLPGPPLFDDDILDLDAADANNKTGSTSNADEATKSSSKKKKKKANHSESNPIIDLDASHSEPNLKEEPSITPTFDDIDIDDYEAEIDF